MKYGWTPEQVEEMDCVMVDLFLNIISAQNQLEEQELRRQQAGARTSAGPGSQIRSLLPEGASTFNPSAGRKRK